VPDDFRVAQPRVAAGVLFRDERGRVLLVKPSYKEGWDLPGGYVEPGESPKQAATREVLEELGVRCDVGGLIVVDWAPHPNEGDKLLFIFDGGSLNLHGLELEASELERAEYFDMGDLGQVLPERILDRVTCAVSGAGNGYLEHGKPASTNLQH
jgi:8-oxo-dGTP diphosphatase